MAAARASGGLICISNKECFQVTNMLANRYFILLRGKLNFVECVLMNVYASNEVVKRKETWEEITQIRNTSPIRGR